MQISMGVSTNTSVAAEIVGLDLDVLFSLRDTTAHRSAVKEQAFDV